MKKIALITGGAKRLGKEIALHLAANQWEIALHYNNSHEEANKTTQELSKFTKAISIQQDLNDLDKVTNILKETQNALGTPSLLINNASIFERDQRQVTVESMQRHMNINCFAPILLTQYFAHLSKEKKQVINIGDSNLQHTYKNFLPYTISKLALQNSEKSLNEKFFPHCIVSTLNLGMTTPPEDSTEKAIFEEILTNNPSRAHTKKSMIEEIDSILSEIFDTHHASSEEFQGT